MGKGFLEMWEEQAIRAGGQAFPWWLMVYGLYPFDATAMTGGAFFSFFTHPE